MNIDGLLADFRTWLEGLRDVPPAAPAGDGVSMRELVELFVALKQEINLQTRSVRGVLDQNRELLESRGGAEGEPDRGHLKSLIELHDALSLGNTQAGQAELPTTPELPHIPRPGPLGRLFGADVGRLREHIGVLDDALGDARRRLEGIRAGYEMGLRRVEKAIADAGLERIECVGRPFDPESMRLLEAVADSGRAADTVVEVVKPGYRHGGKLFREALVRVAK